MKHSLTPGPAILVHWTYTQDEWKRFQRWSIKRKSFFRYLVYYFFAPGHVPEIRISNNNVWIGNTLQHFRSHDLQLKRVDIRDTGNMNILEITFISFNEQHPGLDEIRLPIPRGKLREAIEVQELLSHQP